MTTIHNFFEYCNENYIKQHIPSDQSSKSNFSDISNTNNKKLASFLNELKSSDTISSKDLKLIKTIYDFKHEFINSTVEQQSTICKNINNIIMEVEKANTLTEKICILSNYGISLFISYETGENPKEGLPYILNIGKCGLSFSKNYYFDNKYNRELNGYNKYLNKTLNILKNTYTDFKSLNIDEISEDVKYVENMLAPYILSNECKRNVKQRTNMYKLSEIDSKFPNLNILSSCFLSEYNLTDKPNTNVIFSSNLESCKQFDITTSYNEINDKTCYNNGEYYWYFLNDLFEKYDNKKNSVKSKIDNYIKWKIINNFMGSISENIRVEQFNFYCKFLSGQSEEKHIDERSINYLIESLPELIGKVFCDKYFTSDHKALMTHLIKYLLDAYEHNFTKKCNWIDNYSCKYALDKLNVLRQDHNQKVGYPEQDNYQDKYNKLYTILGDDYHNLSLYDFELKLVKWNQLLDIERLNKIEKDMTEWEMSPVMTNAYFHPLKNEIVFPAGILQEPFFTYLTSKQINNGIDITTDEKYKELFDDRIRLLNNHPSLKYITMASNFGSIGAVIGHEISHGFDDNGSKYDSNGKMVTWWTENVETNYKQITDKIVDQFNEYSMDLNIDGINETFKIDGKLTLGENIADLFGLIIAIDSYKLFYKDTDQSKPLDEGLLELFVSFANTWRYIESPNKTKNRIAIDVHSPPMFRVNGTVANIEDFYRIFNIDYSTSNIIKIFNEKILNINTYQSNENILTI